MTIISVSKIVVKNNVISIHFGNEDSTSIFYSSGNRQQPLCLLPLNFPRAIFMHALVAKMRLTPLECRDGYAAHNTNTNNLVKRIETQSLLL